MISGSNRDVVLLLSIAVIFSAGFAGGGAAVAYLFDEESTDATVEFVGALSADIVGVEPTSIERGDRGGSITVYADVPVPDRVNESSLSLEVGDGGGRIDARNAQCHSGSQGAWNCVITFDRAGLLALTDGVGTVGIVLHGHWQTGDQFTGTYNVTIIDPSEQKGKRGPTPTISADSNESDVNTTDAGTDNGTVNGSDSTSDGENVSDDVTEGVLTGGNNSDTGDSSVENESSVTGNETNEGGSNDEIQDTAENETTDDTENTPEQTSDGTSDGADGADDTESGTDVGDETEDDVKVETEDETEGETVTGNQSETS